MEFLSFTLVQLMVLILFCSPCTILVRPQLFSLLIPPAPLSFSSPHISFLLETAQPRLPNLPYVLLNVLSTETAYAPLVLTLTPSLVVGIAPPLVVVGMMYPLVVVGMSHLLVVAGVIWMTR